MAFVVPHLGDFGTRFPQFGSLDGSQIDAALREATNVVGSPETTRWLERDYALAIMLLAAHNLVAEGALSGGATSADRQYAGPITRQRVGDIETSYGASAGSAFSTSSSAQSGYASTAFGRRFVALMRGNFGGPMVA